MKTGTCWTHGYTKETPNWIGYDHLIHARNTKVGFAMLCENSRWFLNVGEARFWTDRATGDQVTCLVCATKLR